jgi:xylitol oxidase
MSDERRNWAGNQDYGATAIHHPATVETVQQLVAGARHARVIGARHSFSAVGATSGDLLDLDRLDHVLAIDPDTCTATIEAGVRYEALAPVLEEAGLALPNLASLPWITVAGACATATHGSGDRQQLLAAAVSALDLVTAGGDIVTLTRQRDGDRFRSALVGLGTLGIVARLTLDLVPSFAMRQTVYEALPIERVLTDFDAIMGGAYSVSLFTDWQGDTIDMVWVKRRGDETQPEDDADYFGARPAAATRTLGDQSAGERVTAQLGVPGPWHERLPHFRAGAMPPTGAELQSEYFVPRRHAAAAVRAFAALGPQLAPALILSEVRTVAADDCWISPYHERDSVGLHCTWLPDWPAVRERLTLIEGALAPFDARPHWGKMFTLPPEVVRPRYSRLAEFDALRRQFDPTGKFGNPFIERYIGGEV